jgi:potassium inwardly-rectifying channel subfamily J
MFRVADTQKSYIVNSHVRARVVRTRLTAEGELVEFHQEDLRLRIDRCDNRIMMLWPTLVVHAIDASSPFYEMSAESLAREQLEIVVTLEGGVESTGLQIQARSSYLPSEILWGHRFQSVCSQRVGLETRVSSFRD